MTVCASGCAYTTIAKAIASASSGDTISIQDAVHSEASMVVDRDLTIEGQGAANTAIDGTGPLPLSLTNGGVFLVNGGVTVTIQDLTIRNGIASNGAGIYNNGAVTINDSVFTSNVAADKNGCCNGGGIYNSGTLTINHSTLAGNYAGFFHAFGPGGGGLYNSGTVTINDSTISDNSGTGVGGGIYNDSSGVATINNTIVSKNQVGYFGGGIYSSGTITINGSTLSSNNSTDYGGGFFGGGAVTISESTVAGNSASVYGGGIVNFGGTATISRSTVSSNNSAEGGGLLSNGQTTIIESTISGNSAGNGGGIAIEATGSAKISNSTLADNSATYGGGIYNINAYSDGATVKNSIVANNTGGGTDCYGTIDALGTNLNTDGSCGTSNFTAVTAPQLDLNVQALNPPGSTATEALLPGSVAIDAAPDCTDAFGNPVATDQRGVARPDSGSACDIGAYEFSDTQFQSFKARVSFRRRMGMTTAITLNSTFTLSPGKSVSPTTDDMVLQVGSYTTSIPAGSFAKQGNGSFTFAGILGGASISAKITPLRNASYRFHFTGSGAGVVSAGSAADVPETSGAKPVALVIGANYGLKP